MPKVTGTRDHNARELFTRLQRGPAALRNTTGCTVEDYNLWVSTWILPQIIDLIPQLRKDPPAYQLMSSKQDAQPEPESVKEPKTYGLMTVLELQKETVRRGLGLKNLRDYKRDELTKVLQADDRSEIETVRTRYQDARIKRDGMYFVIVEGGNRIISRRADTGPEAWQDAAEDVRRLNREEKQL
jgi:hypothetical protein